MTSKILKLIFMDELTKIILNLNQDVKQIKDAQSFEGAKKWVEKHGPDLYEVNDEDINGDSIPDIIVRNKKTNQNVIVNGYTTDDSTYPYRYSYYTQYPTAEARKAARDDGITYREHIKAMYNPQYDQWGMKLQRGANGEPLYANQEGLKFEATMKNAGYNKIIKPKDKTPYQAFVAGVVKPIYDVIKRINQMQNLATNPQLLTKVAAIMWNQTILLPAMHYVYGAAIQQVDDKEWKKLRNKKQVKEAILSYVKYYLSNERRLLDFVPLFVSVCNDGGLNPIPTEVVNWIPGFLKCRLLNKGTPDLADKEGWANIDRAFDQQFPNI